MTKTALFFLGLAAGSVLSFFLLPVWIMPLIKIANEQAQSNWLGFAGTLIAGTMTAVVTAMSIGVSAYVIKQQISVGLYSREEDRIERQLPGLQATQLMIEECTHLAASFMATMSFSGDLRRPLPNLVSAVDHVKRQIDMRIANDVLPEIPEPMKRDLLMVLGHIGNSVVRTAELRQLAERATDAEFFRAEGAYHSQIEMTNSAIFTAGEYLHHLGIRVVELQARLRVYNREIERLLPTKRD